MSEKMNTNDLLTSHSRYKYYLLKYLEGNKSHFNSFRQVCEFLGLSKFKMERYLHELKSELYRYETNPSITLTEDGEIVSKNLTMLVVKEQRLMYLKESIQFQLMHEVLINEQSIDTFSQQSFLSLSQSYTLKNGLKKLLKTEGIDYKKSELLGDEFKLRNFLYSFYYDYFNGIEYPFSEEIKKKVRIIMQRLIYFFNLTLPNTKQTKLELFLSILLLRIRRQHFIRETYFLDWESNSLEEKELYSMIAKELFEGRENQLEHSKTELQYLTLFLYLEEIIPQTPLKLNAKLGTEAEALTQQFVTNLMNDLSFRSVVTSEQKVRYKEAIAADILRINQKWLIYQFKSSTFVSDEQITFFKESYPMFDQVIQAEFKKWDQIQLLKTAEEKVKLYYDYMFTLIVHLPMTSLEEKIYVCVDFSHGKNYTKYILEMIKSFKNLNIQLEERVSSNTQLYVSDAVISKLRCQQIIWKNPPNSDDWEEFGNVVLHLKRGEKNE